MFRLSLDIETPGVPGSGDFGNQTEIQIRPGRQSGIDAFEA